MTLSIDNVLVYQKRRAHVAQWLKNHGGGIAVLPTAPQSMRNRDNEYPYRADSYFYYLTGFTEPQSWLIITETGHCTLFCQAKNIEHEIWTGYRLGPDAAPQALGVDAAYPIDELNEHIPHLLANQAAVWFPFAVHSRLETQIDQWLQTVRSRVRLGVICPQAQYDLCALLDDMRLVKDEHEIALMRQAGEISALGHIRAMQRCAQMISKGEDIREYHLEAELQHVFRLHGAQDVSFNTIVATEANACVLHYHASTTPICSGHMVLIDAGCEYKHYAGDISRTFPANGHFTAPQKDLYNLVLAAQKAAFVQVKPNAPFNGAHHAAVRVLCEGMLDLGLLSKNTHGNVDDAIENNAYKRFYMHNTSHWLGIDVHDCGNYSDHQAQPQSVYNEETNTTTFSRPSRPLKPGMLLTLEPGIYVQAFDDVPQHFHNIGIRIEDDALVTSTGAELITRTAPVEPQEIERLMQDSA